LEDAAFLAKTEKKEAIKNAWYAKDAKRSEAFSKTLEANGGQLPASMTTTSKEIAAEDAENLLKTVILSRQERLKELYQSDALAYDQELEARGLALYSIRA
jgi:hypothetical protein